MISGTGKTLFVEIDRLIHPEMRVTPVEGWPRSQTPRFSIPATSSICGSGCVQTASACGAGCGSKRRAPSPGPAAKPLTGQRNVVPRRDGR